VSRTVLVAGCGVAGAEAAGAARQASPDADVVLAGAEPWPFYARIRLPEVVAGRIAPERLVLRSPAWFEERRVRFLPGTRLEGIDTAAAVARLSGGTALPYDALVLATGARPNVLPVPGADLAGVLTLRQMADAVRLGEAARAGGPVAVLGGGLLGLEVAAAIRGLGAEVTVIEVADWLLPRQLDREGGEVLQATLERRGIRFVLGAPARAIEGGGGRVEAVLLPSGERLPASLVLVAAGVKPEVAIAREAGIAVERGVRVDDRMATSVAGVFAAGDCAEHRGRLYGIWPASEAQGRVAGAAAAGAADARYEGSVPQNTLKVTDVAVFSMGEVAGAPAAAGTRVRNGDVYRRLVADDAGRLVGAVLIGDIKERRAIAAAVASRAAWQETASR